MAVNYLISSHETFTTAILPPSVVAEFKVPLVSVDEEGNETPRTWTLEQINDSGLHRAGKAFPVKEDEDGVPQREFEGEPTDWAIPLGSVGRNLIAFIDALADAKPVERNHVFLSVKQTHEYLADGSLPSPLT